MSQGIVESQGSESDSQQGTGTRSKLVQRLVNAGPDLPAFVNDLITAQAITVAGTEAAAFAVEKVATEGQTDFVLRPVAHVRQDNSNPEARSAALTAFQDLIRPCIDQSKDGALEIGGNDVAGEPQYCLVTLLRSEGTVVAASAVITRCMNMERARQRLLSMQLVGGYFELFGLRRNTEQTRLVAQGHQHVLQLATAVATAEGFESAGMNLCNELANRTGAVRVSLGWLKGRQIRVKAMSHTEQFDKKQELIVQIEQAMEECADQQEPVQFNPAPEAQNTPNVSRSAGELSRRQGNNTILSLPLRRRDEVIGVITMEFPQGHELGPNIAGGLAVAVDLLAPQLYDRYQNDRWLITKTGLSIREVAKKAVGPKYTLSKLIIAGSLGVAYLASPWSPWLPMYRISAPFQFVSTEQRSISPPFEGYLVEVHKRPGDVVKAGDPLFTLDSKEIALKKIEAEKQALSAQREAEAYYAMGKTSEAKIARSNQQRAEAQVDLYGHYLQQTVTRAPIDGVVLSGDLQDRIGGPVKREDSLMEVGSPEALRLEMSVNERDIQFVHDDGTQRGELATNAMPTASSQLTVERIVPMGTARDASNVFTVFATPDTIDPNWKPGAMGEARVEVGRRSWFWIWTHRFVDWMRLKFWL